MWRQFNSALLEVATKVSGTAGKFYGKKGIVCWNENSRKLVEEKE